MLPAFLAPGFDSSITLNITQMSPFVYALADRNLVRVFAYSINKLADE
jgi:hypothetical protein